MTQAQTTASRWGRLGALSIEIPAVLVIFAIMFQIVANTVMRKVFNSPIEATLEITQYWAMPLIAFLGIMAAQIQGQHIAADLLYRRLPPAAQLVMRTAGNLLCLITSAMFAWNTWVEATHAHEIRMTAGVAKLISWPVYYIVPVAFAVLTVNFAYLLLARRDQQFQKEL